MSRHLQLMCDISHLLCSALSYYNHPVIANDEHTMHLMRPLIDTVPGARAVVLFYPLALVCISVCGRIVSTFYLSFILHRKNHRRVSAPDVVWQNNTALCSFLLYSLARISPLGSPSAER
jgi:hypothetical protein